MSNCNICDGKYIGILQRNYFCNNQYINFTRSYPLIDLKGKIVIQGINNGGLDINS